MGYPTSYRGRGRQGGRAQAAQPPGPDWSDLEGFGPYAGVAAASVAFWALQQALPDLPQMPNGYHKVNSHPGYTLALDCGFPPLKIINGVAPGCRTKYGVIISRAIWQSPPGAATLTAAQVWEWDSDAFPIYLAGTLIQYGATPARRWDRTVAGARFYPYAWAGEIPDIRVPPNSLPQVRAYHPPDVDARRTSVGVWAPWDVVPGNPDLPLPDVGAGVRTASWIRGRSRAMARAVAAASTAEIKTPANSRAGRAFYAMYRAFNFLGDAFGFTRALYNAIPRGMRGSSRRLGAMASDIYDYVNYLAHAPRDERQDYLMNAALNAAQWKFLDSAFGGAQSANFAAMSRGSVDAARFASTVESAARFGQGSIERASNRSQSSARW